MANAHALKRSWRRWKLVAIAAVAAVPILAAIGCGSGSSESFTAILWVDFVRFGGITYIQLHVDREPPLEEGDLGPEFARVTFKYEGNVSDPVRTKNGRDGDAGYLDPGTPVFAVKGYKAQFLLAARSSGALVLYVADTNPSARTGADLLDIGGKVRYVGVNSPVDGSELAAIRDPSQVETLVDMVLVAPVDQTRRDQDSPRYFIAFHLDDGTTLVRAYWLGSGELSRGIMLPREFRTAIEEALP